MSEDKLTAEKLDELERLATLASKQCECHSDAFTDCDRCRAGWKLNGMVRAGTVLALVAAARELTDIRARIAEATASKGGQQTGPSGAYHMLALRTAAAEKERDELRRMLHEATAERDRLRFSSEEYERGLADGAVNHAKTHAMLSGLRAGIEELVKERDELRAKVAELLALCHKLRSGGHGQ